MTDFNACKTAKSVKDSARDLAFETLVAQFSEVFGADNVSVVGNAEIAVCVGTRVLSDGTEGEVCVTIKPVSKDFDRRVTASGKVFEPFERLVAADLYADERTEKERKAEEKARAKERKKQADAAARAKKAEAGKEAKPSA